MITVSGSGSPSKPSITHAPPPGGAPKRAALMAAIRSAGSPVVAPTTTPTPTTPAPAPAPPPAAPAAAAPAAAPTKGPPPPAPAPAPPAALPTMPVAVITVGEGKDNPVPMYTIRYDPRLLPKVTGGPDKVDTIFKFGPAGSAVKKNCWFIGRGEDKTWHCTNAKKDYTFNRDETQYGIPFKTTKPLDFKTNDPGLGVRLLGPFATMREARQFKGQIRKAMAATLAQEKAAATALEAETAAAAERARAAQRAAAKPVTPPAAPPASPATVE